MNAINVIAPYKYLGMWVFDDAPVGLVQEPFVGGADTLIDRAVAAIPNAEKGFALLFSAAHFPGAQFKLEDAATLFAPKAMLEKIRAGADPASIAASWAADEEKWRVSRAKYLLY